MEGAHDKSDYRSRSPRLPTAAEYELVGRHFVLALRQARKVANMEEAHERWMEWFMQAEWNKEPEKGNEEEPDKTNPKQPEEEPEKTREEQPEKAREEQPCSLKMSAES